MIRGYGLAAAMAFGVAGIDAAAAAADNRTPQQIVEAFNAARMSFDQQTVRDLTDPDYVEISPIGEVDRRDAVIGFYAADKRVPAPPAALEDVEARTVGEGATLVTLRIVYTLPAREAGAAPVRRALRGSFVTHRAAAGWRIVYAQFTPIRERTPLPATPAR